MNLCPRCGLDCESRDNLEANEGFCMNCASDLYGYWSKIFSRKNIVEDKDRKSYYIIHEIYG